MLTEKVNECTSKAIDNVRVKKAIEERDKRGNIQLESINSKIIKRQSNSNFFKMIVRVGIDYNIKTANENSKEDILIDISFIVNNKTGAETFDVLNVTFVPEI